jgi:hypothetical protein
MIVKKRVRFLYLEKECLILVAKELMEDDPEGPWRLCITDERYQEARGVS